MGTRVVDDSRIGRDGLQRIFLALHIVLLAQQVVFREEVSIGKGVVLVAQFLGQGDSVLHANHRRIMLLVNIAVNTANTGETHQFIMLVAKCPIEG